MYQDSEFGAPYLAPFYFYFMVTWVQADLIKLLCVNVLGLYVLCKLKRSTI